MDVKNNIFIFRILFIDMIKKLRKMFRLKHIINQNKLKMICYKFATINQSEYIVLMKKYDVYNVMWKFFLSIT